MEETGWGELTTCCESDYAPSRKIQKVDELLIRRQLEMGLCKLKPANPPEEIMPYQREVEVKELTLAIQFDLLREAIEGELLPRVGSFRIWAPAVWRLLHPERYLRSLQLPGQRSAEIQPAETVSF